MQQPTCNIDFSRSFYHIFFSFVLIDLKPFVLKEKVLGEKCEKVWKSAEKKKAYTTTTERKSFGELFWPQRKAFQASGGYKNPIKNQENHIHHRKLSSVDPILFCKEKFCTGAGRCMLSFPRSVKNSETILPFSCCPLVFPWYFQIGTPQNPKDPTVLKTLRDSELLRRSVFTTPPDLLRREPLNLRGEMPAKPRKILPAQGWSP